MRSAFQRLVLVVVVLVLLVPQTGCDGGGGGGSVTEPANRVLLRVPFVGQQTQVWCWAAAIEMVTRYYNRGIPQCVTLSQYLFFDCCTFAPLCLVAAPNMQTIQAGLFGLAGLSSAYVPGPISFADVAAEINAGRPIIIGYRGSFSGHVVVIYGYDPAGSLWIHDPFFGTFGPVPYGQAFSYSGQLAWTDTILGIR